MNFMLWTTHTETLVCTSRYTYACETGPYVRFEVYIGNGTSADDGCGACARRGSCWLPLD